MPNPGTSDDTVVPTSTLLSSPSASPSPSPSDTAAPTPTDSSAPTPTPAPPVAYIVTFAAGTTAADQGASMAVAARPMSKPSPCC